MLESTEEKILLIEALVLEQEGAAQNIFSPGFTAVRSQNEEIIQRNENLKNQIEFLQKEISQLSL